MVMDSTIKSMLMAQDHVEQLVEMSLQGDINSQLQLEQFGYNFDLSAQDNIHILQQLAARGDIDASLALQAFGFDTDLMEQDFGYRLDLKDKDLENALALSTQDHSQWLERDTQSHTNTLEEIAARGDVEGNLAEEAFTRGLQQSYLDSVERRSFHLSDEIRTIYATEGLTPRQQQHAVDLAIQRYDDDIAMMQTFYTSNPYWDSDWEFPETDTGGGDGGGGSGDGGSGSGDGDGDGDGDGGGRGGRGGGGRG